MATTLSPSWRSPESPSDTVGRPVAFTLSTARSASASPPITRATNVRVGVVEVVTVIRCAPSTTWKFVTTIPSERTMNPVPTPRPGCEPPKTFDSSRFVVTFTTAGRARWTTLTTRSAFVPPGIGEGEGSEGATDAGLIDECVETCRGVPLPETTAPEVHAAAAMARSARLSRVDDLGRTREQPNAAEVGDVHHPEGRVVAAPARQVGRDERRLVGDAERDALRVDGGRLLGPGQDATAGLVQGILRRGSRVRVHGQQVGVPHGLRPWPALPRDQPAPLDQAVVHLDLDAVGRGQLPGCLDGPVERTRPHRDDRRRPEGLPEQPGRLPPPTRQREPL